MGSPQQTSSPPPASLTTTTFPQMSHLNTCPSFDTFTMIFSSFVQDYPGIKRRFFNDCEFLMASITRVHQSDTLLKRKISNYWLLFPRLGGFFASSGVFISGRICVIGKHWYSSQAHDGHFLRSCSLLSSVSSFPQSRQTYLPGPTFCPALYVFCSVKRFTKTSMHVEDIYGLRSSTSKQI